MNRVRAKRPNPVVVDVETTGLGIYGNDRLVEIAIITLDPETWAIRDEYDTLINPERDVGPTGVHGITAGMVELAPTFAEILGPIARRLRNSVLIAHNLPFDTRMLEYEFCRSQVPIGFGKGLCTLRATRERLALACEDRGIRIADAHRALADARATVELARSLGFRDRHDFVSPVQVEAISSDGNTRTYRRGLASAEASPMHRVVRRSRYPHGEEGIAQYLHTLDWVLDDGVIDRTERERMEELANEWDISPERQREVHRHYLDCMIEAAERDGFVTEAENEILMRIADQLGIDTTAVPEADSMISVPDPFPGMGICFTGQAVVDDRQWVRSKLENLARENGWKPLKNVTKKHCDLLVAADPSTMSGKGKKARLYGKPVVSVADFLELARSNESR